MTSLDLYTILSSKYPARVVSSVCCTNIECRKNGYCTDKQNLPVLDFDEIKKDFYNGKKVTMPASVDAIGIGIKQKHFCFIELKGWDSYIAHLKQQKKTPQQTAAGYNLAGKLSDSQNLCKIITGDNDVFAHMPTVFILVTDIDVNNYGMESFANSMFSLAGIGTDIYSECLSNARKTLDSEIHIDRYFVYCKKFDQLLSTL